MNMSFQKSSPTIVQPSVSLLASTPSPERLVLNAARLCWKSGEAGETELSPSDLTLLETLKRSGHHSPFEHVSFTFLIKNISRVASHQLVRHRLASYTQQSFRYTEPDSAYVLPEALLSEKVKEKVLKAIEENKHLYSELVDAGVPKEDARYLFMPAGTSDIVVTMNARELLHFFTVRTCQRAQFEIRTIAEAMLLLCREKAPNLFSDAGPNCVRGECKERYSCRKERQTNP